MLGVLWGGGGQRLYSRSPGTVGAGDHQYPALDHLAYKTSRFESKSSAETNLRVQSWESQLHLQQTQRVGCLEQAKVATSKIPESSKSSRNRPIVKVLMAPIFGDTHEKSVLLHRGIVREVSKLRPLRPCLMSACHMRRMLLLDLYERETHTFNARTNQTAASRWKRYARMLPPMSQGSYSNCSNKKGIQTNAPPLRSAVLLFQTAPHAPKSRKNRVLVWNLLYKVVVELPSAVYALQRMNWSLSPGPLGAELLSAAFWRLVTRYHVSPESQSRSDR